MALAARDKFYTHFLGGLCKNLQSVTNPMSTNHNKWKCREIGNLSRLCNMTTRNSRVSVHSSTKIQKATSEHKVEKQHAILTLFSNATIRKGSTNISINTLSNLQHYQYQVPTKTYKRLKPLSDSESD